MTFQNHIVWITGASSGIGRAVAIEFAKQGATVAVTARRIDELDKLVSEIKNFGGKAKAFYCDILEEKSIQSCTQKIIQEFNKLDVAVANAGFGVFGKMEDLTQEEWRRQLEGNVIGLALTAKYALPHLKQTKGRLALVGSVGAYLPNPYVGAYGASKAAVNSIGLTFQVELQGTGVSCTTLHPGFVKSEIARIDNHGVWHPDRKDPRPAKMMWPTEKAAQVMVKAIWQRKRNYIFTAHGKIFIWIQRLFPSVMRKLMAKAPKPS
ncbi:SDR family NAD(P)-dependent oxidoreductase [Flavobacterium lacus]|uniref:Short-subunit dehydrogenase n=1 Tax=Flavobacterium lacus TaxID=1353778 RepID=A0A328WYJ3_9FLAO|nr:SDR family oxidoreductase [Flavobacterium lacus]RAR50345.1 short-subunit dehydrogenase [Flavobacterium lacus]